MATLQIVDCDDLVDWTGTTCTLANDGADKQEGTASLTLTNTGGGANWYAATFNPAGTWDWSASTLLRCWSKLCDRVRVNDSDGDAEYWAGPGGAAWSEDDYTFGAGTAVGTPDYTKMTSIQVYGNGANGEVAKFDDIRVDVSGLSIPVAMHHYGHHISKIIRG